MIRLTVRPEYPGFDAEVRRPGNAFLVKCPAPTTAQFKKKNFWTKAATELRAAYSGVCAYTCMYLLDGGSVDHFYAKSTFPHLAYEWSNYRFASGRINSTKGNLATILDPFEIQDDWFFMQVPTCLIQPNPELAKDLRVKIKATINDLRLNQDDNYVQERCNILMDYARGDVALAFLARRYPFIAKEIERQGLSEEELRGRFKMAH